MSIRATSKGEMSVRGTPRFRGRWALAVSLLMLAPGACSDSTAEKLAAAKLAGGCSINTECEGELICAFGRCHKACTKDRDCDVPQRCVKSETGADVCQLPDETRCERDQDCKGVQVCAADLECHDACKLATDCIGDQACSPAGECASTDPARDVVDSSGHLRPGRQSDDAGVGGSSGAGGSGNQSSGGSGGTTPRDAGSSGAGGEPVGPDGSTPDSGPGEGSGGSSVTDAGRDAARTDGSVKADFVETGDTETMSNNVYQDAIPAMRTASIYLPSADEDWFSFVAPAGNGAFVIQVTVDQPGGGRAMVTAFDSVNRNQIGSHQEGAGSRFDVFVTVRAGSMTYFQFKPYAGIVGDHHADITFGGFPENDTQEPNDTKDAAATIPLNTDVAAQCIPAHVSNTDSHADDWYKVTLAAGPAVFKLVKDYAPGPRMMVSWAGAVGATETGLVTTPGSTDTWTFNAATAGDYYLHITNYAGTIPIFFFGEVPEVAKSQYVFQVQQ